MMRLGPTSVATLDRRTSPGKSVFLCRSAKLDKIAPEPLELSPLCG